MSGTIHRFFEPLSDREAMLLMTTMVVGGSEEIQLFEHLDPEQRDRLHSKAQALAEIPPQKRVPFMVKEMKKALKFKGLRGIERVDPSWLLSMMRGESPRVVAAILVTLPAPTVRSVLKRLPSGVRNKLPPKGEIGQVPVELIRCVRQIFESRFSAMPSSGGRFLQFQDLVGLERKELFLLMRELGLVELGQAFGAVGKLALAELCRRLDRPRAEELILAVRRSSKVDAPDLKASQHFLSRVVVNFDDSEDLFRKAGLWRIAKACLLEGERFCEAIKQRVPKDVGRLFDDYVRTARGWDSLDELAVKRFQDSIVVRIKVMSEEGRLSPRWSHLQMSLHDEEYGAQLQLSDKIPEGSDVREPLDDRGPEDPLD